MSALEDQLPQRLHDLATGAGTGPVPVADDLARGHRALRRRQALRVATGALAVLAVVGTGVAVAPRGEPVRGLPAVRPSAPVSPSSSGTASPAPEVTAEPTPDAQASRRAQAAAQAAQDAWRRRRLDGGAGGGPAFPHWRHQLFALTRTLLDPAGSHLDYSTDSLQGGSSGSGVTLGIKMGWRNPGRPGEGLVQVQVSDEDASPADHCLTFGGDCPRTVLGDGEEFRVGSGPGGAMTVFHQRPDGVSVVVHVESLFGNNSAVAVPDLPVTRQDLFRYVLDDRIALPVPGS